jgi:hypothetical protein
VGLDVRRCTVASRLSIRQQRLHRAFAYEHRHVRVALLHLREAAGKQHGAAAAGCALIFISRSMASEIAKCRKVIEQANIERQ